MYNMYTDCFKFTEKPNGFRFTSVYFVALWMVTLKRNRNKVGQLANNKIYLDKHGFIQYFKSTIRI